MSGIRLEVFAAAHLDSLDSLVADPDTRRFTRIPEHAPPDFARTWLERYELGRREGTREAFVVVDSSDGTFLGMTMAPRIDREAATAELGYVISPEARGRGVATEALRQTTRWAFTEGMLRLELLIDVGNPASKRVAERCGYVFEGVMRSVHFKADLRGDTELWSRLPTDP
ncbi:MAG TPA: GNAT family N-acetyltransferase [Gaiellaceae bacterium]|jgi:RimJ/RimL family protein N-acetyltransferase